MALIRYEYYSCALEKNTGAYVVLPEHRDRKGKEEKLKVLYLLHGLGDDYTKWVRRTPIERYAKDDDWVVVMPDGEKSFYVNCPNGDAYGDYMGEELPEIMRATFPFISERREDTFVAGLSMGGYGSMKLALTYPDQYSAAACFSGALDADFWFENYPEERYIYERIFASKEAVKNTDNDLFYLVGKLKEKGSAIPRIYLSCGTEDSIYPESVTFRKCLDRHQVPYTYEEWEGNHNWVFWDESIRRALKWFAGVR